MTHLRKLALTASILVAASLGMPVGQVIAATAPGTDAICGATGADVGPLTYDPNLGAYYQTWKGWIVGCGYANIYMHGIYTAYDGDGYAIKTDRWPDSGDNVCPSTSSCTSPSISTYLTSSQRSRFGYGCATFRFFIDTGPTEECRSAHDYNPVPAFEVDGR